MALIALYYDLRPRYLTVHVYCLVMGHGSPGYPVTARDFCKQLGASRQTSTAECKLQELRRSYQLRVLLHHLLSTCQSVSQSANQLQLPSQCLEKSLILLHQLSMSQTRRDFLQLLWLQSSSVEHI